MKDASSKSVIYNIQGFDNPENGYVEDLSSYAETANRSMERRIDVSSAFAAVSRGKEESSNPTSRYNQLKEEAAMHTASRPLEFIPIELYFRHIVGSKGFVSVELDLSTDDEVRNVVMDYHKFSNYITKFGFVEHVGNGQYLIKTNLRALHNAGIKDTDIPYAKLYKGFRVFKLEIPMFVFNHLVTHTMISKETRSERVTTLDESKYWIPEDFIEKLMGYEVEFKKVAVRLEGDEQLAARTITAMRELRNQYSDSKDYPSFIKTMLMQPADAMSMVFKVLGYKKEIYQRSMLEMRYKTVIMGAWSHDLTWKNLLLERGGMSVWKNWVQPETKKVAEVLAKFLLV